MGIKLEVAEREGDVAWMRLALSQAEQAAEAGEVPVGAVIVLNGVCIAQANNNPISSSDATGHAELNVIRQACQFLENYRLSGAELYVTLEPCTMCLGGIIHSRLQRVVFATAEPRAGAIISAAAFEFEPYNHSIEYTSNVLQAESSNLLKSFFKNRR